MYAFKRILVGLDLSEHDKTIVQYVNYLCQIFEADRIYFFHVAKTFELPDDLIKKYPDLIAPVDETIHKQLETFVSKYFKANVESVIEVHEGEAIAKILKWSNFKDVDLVVMGKKSTLNGNGHLPTKLVKTSHCSVLFIPEAVQMSINKIMVSVDFSKHVKRTVEVAVRMQQKLNCDILFHHSYQVPIGYHASGHTYEEFVEIMKNHAMNDLNNLLQTNNVETKKLTKVLSLDEQNDPAEQVKNVASDEKVDFLVIGSKGRSGMASFLMGSVAEKICRIQSTQPTLVVKDKYANMGFFEALLKL